MQALSGRVALLLLNFELRDQLEHYNELNDKIKEHDKKLETINRDNELFYVLQTVLGVGSMTVACCLSLVSDPDFSPRLVPSLLVAAPAKVLALQKQKRAMIHSFIAQSLTLQMGIKC